MKMDTGHWSYMTVDDGLCCFDTRDRAIEAAIKSAERSQEQVEVYDPSGVVTAIARGDLPTHEQKCMDPDVFGHED